MFNILLRNRKEKQKKNKKYHVTRCLNIWTGEYEDMDMVTDNLGLSNLVVNGFEELEIEGI